MKQMSAERWATVNYAVSVLSLYCEQKEVLRIGKETRSVSSFINRKSEASVPCNSDVMLGNPATILSSCIRKALHTC